MLYWLTDFAALLNKNPLSGEKANNKQPKFWRPKRSIGVSGRK